MKSLAMKNLTAPLTRAIAALVISTTTLTGCGLKTVRQSAATHESADATAQQLIAGRDARRATSITGAVVTDIPYVDVNPVQTRPRYPSSFRRNVTLNEPLGVAMPVLARRIEAMLGVNVEYQAEVTETGDKGDARPALAPPLNRGDAVNLPPLELLLSTAPSTAIPIAYTGQAIGLFDTIASATESYWRYEPSTQTVLFYRYLVESFRIPAVQGESSSSAKMGGVNNSSGGGDQDGQMLSMASAEGQHNTDGSAWKDIETTLQALVSSDGAFTTNPVLGTVTVRDRPDRMGQIRRWLNETADAMSRQVDVEMTIYRVTTRDTDARGVNLFAAFQSAADKYGLIFSGTQGGMDAGSGSMGIIVDEDSRFGGSQMIFEALSTLGNTSVEQSASVMTANNQPAPFKVVRRISYLREVSQGVSQGLGNTAVNTGPTLTPGTVETGLNMYVIPHVQSDGKRLRMKLMASISSLERMNQVGTTDNFIQTPETASREFQNEVWLNSGETVVLASFHQADSGLDSSGPLNSKLWGAGGNRRASHGREIMVIAIRPIVSAARSRI